MEYLLGIDGGGTRTVITCMDMTGRALFRTQAGGLNVNGQSSDMVSYSVKEIIVKLKKAGYSAQACQGIGIGAAGISNVKAGNEIKNLFVKNGFSKSIQIYGDQETALASCTKDGNGIVLIAGTGSICCGKEKGGALIRAGGYGHLVDDLGSAYFLSEYMLRAILQGEDGRGQPTLMKTLVLDELKICSTEELISFIYSEHTGKKDLAGLAPLVEIAAKRGDEAALQLEKACANELARLVIAVRHRLESENRVFFCGSVLQKNQTIRDRTEKEIKRIYPDSLFDIPQIDASEGACRLLLKESKMENR